MAIFSFWNRTEPASATAGARAPAYEPVFLDADDDEKHGRNGHAVDAHKGAVEGLHASIGAGDAAQSDDKQRAEREAEKAKERETARSHSIRFAPLSIPRHRRLQTTAVLLWEILLPLGLLVFFFLWSIPILWPVLFPYLIWVLLVDRAPESGGRRVTWVRRLPVWRYFAEYYPVSLIKTADLPADRPYVFGYHPHGIIGVGAVANFATEATEFATSFPGLRPHLLTLATNFQIPIFRDVIMSFGMCSVSKHSCERILRKGPGNCITIVVGGATESLKAHPGTADLTLRRRLGFIKIAIRAGADLVPVFSFGENDIFQQLSNEKGTAVYAFQKRFQSVFGFTLPLFHGRGIFNYHLGLLPYRHPIVSVVGRPIHVQKTANPSKEMLEDIQRQYIDELMRIWDTWKDAYAANRTKELTIVD
ncbi:putative diacylglycerol acyltransferase type 2b [Tilletiaria anomala UBC 951]|uniref:Diacylglycerol O-acyltransferase n=1 Tax=Tilletiaria anomala (strain ATCC 24038 / CBS 436.72 / UBC 951) TaxID=1037660 RepID=A0A066WAJ3_TILAU|nr:putative diacylglycerol acyltransferase type 2b [Tilletiaria anomala UBC 951]KDN49573.1 putative diacylglycerol acyltransferase type 2b [Tilletiaria anomala UBC 951]